MKTIPASNSVMEQIKHGDIKMRPRIYFALMFIASLAGVLLSGVIFAYLLSVVFFWLRIQSADTMAWGARAHLSEAISSFPWWVLPIAILMFALTVWLLRKQGTMYRHKTSTIIFTLLLVSLLAGIGMSYLTIGNRHPGNQRFNNSQIQHGPNRQAPRTLK